MKTVAINALNSNSGGGKSIRDSYLKLLSAQNLEHRYVVLAAQAAGLEFVKNPHIEILELPRLFSRAAAAPLVYRFVLTRILSSIGAEVVLNLGDLIIRTSARQLYLFDWSYALDVHESVWARMSAHDRFVRKVKLHLLKAHFKEASVVIAQTDQIREMLIRKYGLSDVRVIPGAGTFDETLDSEGVRFDLPEGIRLVCPSVYYPHKNLEVLLDVGELIKSRSLPYRFITTVDPRAGVAAHRFVEAIAERNLKGVVTNIGQVSASQMSSLYGQCDALLMPTLLESFGLIYPEAMLHGLPVLTSDMWFARSVCGDAARYFDPFDKEDILYAIEEVFTDGALKQDLIDAGHRQLDSFPSWQENFAAYQDIIRDLLCAPRAGG